MDELLDTDFEYPLPTPEVARLHAKMLCCRPLKNLWLVDPKAKDKKPGQDLFIAATAIVYDMPIATLDGDDFLAIDNYFALPGVYNPAFDLFTVLPEIDRASSACVVA